MIVQHLRNKVEWMGNLIFSDMFPQSDEWRRLNNMCGSIIYVGTSTSTCFRKRSRLRKSEVVKERYAMEKRKIVRGIILAVLLVCAVFLIYSIVTDPLGEHDIMLALAVTAGFIALEQDKRKER